jgi:hypothetical protein
MLGSVSNSSSFFLQLSFFIFLSDGHKKVTRLIFRDDFSPYFYFFSLIKVICDLTLLVSVDQYFFIFYWRHQMEMATVWWRLSSSDPVSLILCHGPCLLPQHLHVDIAHCTASRTFGKIHGCTRCVVHHPQKCNKIQLTLRTAYCNCLTNSLCPWKIELLSKRL